MRKLEARHGSDEMRDSGATAVEYALMVSLIAVVIAVAVGLIGTSLTGMFSAMAAGL